MNCKLCNWFWSLFSDSTGNEVTSDQNDEQKINLRAKGELLYLLNDPSTPKLVDKIAIPNPPKIHPPFKVKGFSGKAGKFGSNQWHSAQVHTVICKTLEVMQRAFRKPVTRWPGTRVLHINPKSGVDLNAYYDRRSLQFFYAQDPKTRKSVHSSLSVDVVAHELGHALLDSIRPDLWSMQAIEAWSYHEAWADIIAMMGVMQSNTLLKKALAETNNDFAKGSAITRLAEEMGTAIYHHTKGKDGRKPGALRHANNDFKYTRPERLPRRAPHNKLANECHSFGRVFLGAYYEFMWKVFKKEIEKGQRPLEAAQHMRDYCARLIALASALAPATPRFFRSVANVMLSVERQLGGNYQVELRKTFWRRKIVPKQKRMTALSHLSLADIDLTDGDQVETLDGGTAVRRCKKRSLKLCDHFSMRAQDANPLYEVEIEVPDESYLEFDRRGMMVDSDQTSEKEVLEAARNCVQMIHDQEMYMEGPPKEDDYDKQFSIVDGKLVRNFFI